jgi:hypothetical protein
MVSSSPRFPERAGPVLAPHLLEDPGPRDGDHRHSRGRRRAPRVVDGKSVCGVQDHVLQDPRWADAVRTDAGSTSTTRSQTPTGSGLPPRAEVNVGSWEPPLLIPAREREYARTLRRCPRVRVELPTGGVPSAPLPPASTDHASPPTESRVVMARSSGMERTQTIWPQELYAPKGAAEEYSCPVCGIGLTRSDFDPRSATTTAPSAARGRRRRSSGLRRALRLSRFT